MDLIDWAYNLMDNRKYRYGTLIAILLITAVIPLFSSNYVLTVLQNAMFYMLLALGLNIIVGYCGMCDLGYAAKFAIGAYTTGILIKSFNWNFWLTLPVSIIVSAAAAIIIGAPTLKLRSDYLAIVTLGFAEIVRITARNLTITGSATGLNAITRPNFFGLHLTQIINWYYVFLLLVVLFIFISNRIRNSRFGMALTYIREDEDAAQAMGVNTTMYKLSAYIIGAVLGGITGSFYAVRMAAITPGSFDFTQSANIMLAVILGGMGRIPGVIVGAAFFAIFPEVFRDVPIVGDMRMLFFGLLLIIVMIKRPQGLWPERRRGKGKIDKNVAEPRKEQ
ncbi:MAG: branched-chain amino acid ABC transporter permease [Oscillospiraceae bacterium]|nr:branched-chain amino acid ABC transporter permease [Oscillospiraceae bacterium]